MPSADRRTHRTRTARVIIAVLTVIVGLSTACSVSGTPVAAGPAIDGFVTGVTAINNPGGSSSAVSGTLAAGQSAGPTLHLPDNVTAVNGGSVLQSTQSSAPITTMRIALEGKHNGHPTGAPAPGYTELKFGSATSNASVVMTLAQQLPSEDFAFYFAGVDASGVQGPMIRQEVKALKVGTGAVQVTASWDVDSDLDLILVEPSGDKIYFNNKTSSAGGELDLDSNADCDIDGKRNENITYPRAEPGTYTAYVNLYSSCGTPATNYVVTVSVGGQQPQTFTGTFTGAGVHTADTSQIRQVTAFQVT
ncbi:YfaP family protein [Gordonia sp. DT30]|uniref:YfaP family protein n=1 Tax=unclassified Gordonia (in: high G+C Gram-positive bacteria) TaxID=2657482 RepID=UPI003CE6FC00